MSHRPSGMPGKSRSMGFGGFSLGKKGLPGTTALGSEHTESSNNSDERNPLEKFETKQKQRDAPMFCTEENEKKFLQASAGDNVREEDLYDPFNMTEEDDDPQPKKRKKKSRWDTGDADPQPPQPAPPPQVSAALLASLSAPPPPPEVDQPPIPPPNDRLRRPPPPDLRDTSDCPYQQADASPPQQSKDEDSDEDELDKFMAGVEETLEKEDKELEKKKKLKKDVRVDIDDEDDEESYYKARENAPLIAYPDEDDEMEYDSDGNPLPPERSKIIVPLPPVDHAEMDYASFVSNFYTEHADINKLTRPQVEDLMKTLGLKVNGADAPRPVTSFGHFGFDQHIMGVIRKSDYSKPTPIQAQAIPVALTGRDIIGIAKTGSGKTAAFVLPMLVHIMAQSEIQPGDGPIGLICAPTRELCQQIHVECKKFGKSYNLRSVACFGGGSKWEQTKNLNFGAEIVVATPGRLIELIKMKATNFKRVTYLVFDEADRMFDMGFEPQVRSIANNIRPDRQCLLFSATMKRKVEWLCRDILSDSIRIVVGQIGEANEDVVQAVEIFKNQESKWSWLTSHLVEFLSGGSVLIFVTKKVNSEELANNLKEKDYELGLIHGDFDQNERNNVLKRFKHNEFQLLVATDVAARGLDIPQIKTVINYDVARDITTHTHRIGRTGRAGEKGIAYTLITKQEYNFAADLVRNMEGANQFVRSDLVELANKNPWFKKTQSKRNRQASNKEFVPRDRPGLGMGDNDSETSNSNAQAEPEKEKTLAEEEDIVVGNSGGRRTARSLLTSYALTSQVGGQSRLANLKSAFSSGYNRFAKATTAGSATMDTSGGHDKGKQAHFDPADQPKAQSSWES